MRARATHEEASREAASWAEALGRARDGYRQTAATLGTGAWPSEPPAAPGERKDWAALRAGRARGDGALPRGGRAHRAREAREEVVEKLRDIEHTAERLSGSGARRSRARRRWEEATRAEALACEERAETARRLDGGARGERGGARSRRVRGGAGGA
ncbi:MAG: hypothetical protein R3B82_02780 [Sandaracinaceae bacterium]